MPVHAQQNQAVLDQFTKQASAYAALLSRNKDSSLALLLESARPERTDRVLDIGCGAGHLAVALAGITDHVCGVDLTPAMLDQARALQAASGAVNIEWRQADVQSLPFADDTFSLVTSRSMFHHLAAPGEVLAEMKRVCSPQGRIAVIDLTPQLEKAAAFDAVEILRDPSHVRARPTAELRALGSALALTERAVRRHEVRMPLEPVLAASFPDADILDQVRGLYLADAERGVDSLGFSARIEDGLVTVAYPLTLVVWGLEDRTDH